MKETQHWSKGRKSTLKLMWKLTVDDMKSTWAPTKIDIAQGESPVALSVAHTFLDDAPHILRAQDLNIPSPEGDQQRALECFQWLAKKVVPMWMPAWLSRTQPFKMRELKEEAEELELDETDTNADIGSVLMGLRFAMPEADTIHRRSMHKAQQMGVRAAYRGALHHADEQVHMLALLAANLIVFCVPDQEDYKGALLLVEATQSSALMMLDNILLERTDA